MLRLPTLKCLSRSAKIFGPIGAVVVTAVALVFWSAFIVDQVGANQADVASRQVVEGTIGAQATDLAAKVGDFAKNPEAYGRLSGAIDKGWVKQAYGQAFHRNLNVDYVFLIDPDGRTLAAMTRGSPSFSDALGLMGPPLTRMINDSSNPSDHPKAKSGLVLVRGEIALAALSPLTVEAERRGTPSNPAIGSQPQRMLIFVRLLDGPALSTLGARGILPGLKFVRGGTPGPRALNIVLANGKSGGIVTWDRPGKISTFQRIAPVIGAVSLLLILLTLVVVRSAAKDAERLSKSEARAHHMALHDPLTGLPNRTLFMDRLRSMLTQVRRHGGEVAVLFVDLDLFKEINDTLGHAVGDALLKGSAARMLEGLREVDTVARLGGDEFGIVIDGRGHAIDVTLIAKRLLELFNDSFEVDGHTTRLTLSIGAAVAPDHGLDAEGLLKRADLALYNVKANGRNDFCLFDAPMDQALMERRVLERDLRRALKAGNQFELYYQPQIDLASGAICSLEALIRWNHPDRGLVQPGTFIAIAEESGLICEIGDWVIHQACQDAKRWPGLRVSANVSPAQFRESRLVEVVTEALALSGVPAEQMELEITESVLYANPQRARSILDQLHDLGVGLAMDDFGTGYSNLAQLCEMRFSTLKLDRSFVSRIGLDPYAEAISRAVLTMAQVMHMRTVAEGIETEAQAAFLTAQGCTIGQGFLYGRPVPVPAIDKLLQEATQTSATMVAAA
jgi:diguanylate cyclase (GGDEF)-like protein